MSNLFSLPQIATGTTITIASNADWNDTFYVPQPGFPAGNISITGTLSNSSTTVTAVSSVSGLVPGDAVVGYGLPINTTITTVGTTTIVLSNMPTINITSAQLYVFPPPLDLTGIWFSSILRPSVTSASALLLASTANGLMINGNTFGTFGWRVPAASLPAWPPALTSAGTLSCFVDIQATDNTGAIVDMCVSSGPIPVTVLLPVTR